MELMKKMVFAACFVSMIVSLADSVKPEKFSQQLKLIFSLVFICGVLSAVIGISRDENFSLSINFDNTEVFADIEDVSADVMLKTAESSVTDSIKAVLDENGVDHEKITVSINIDDEQRISIKEIGYKGNEFILAKRVIHKNIGDAEVRELED